MKLFFIWILSIFLLHANIHENLTKQAIVKIYVASKVMNYQEPWSNSMQSSTGSGSIIEGGYILTNAHVVANQTFIEVERYGKRKRYIAKVFAISHQSDLALLKVEDSTFYEGVTPLSFGDLPQVEERVVVYGYPMGGSTLSATIGVVSRVEHHVYAHSGEMFLAIQVDAAVNPGNSGGPAISNGKIVGVVMQVMTQSQSIGYLVPSNMLIHFINDMKDGQYDGFSDIGLVTQKLDNPTLRAYYNLEDNDTGKLVDKVVYNSAVQGIVKEGDILTAVDGHNIENDGTVEFRKYEYTEFHHFIDAHQMGEKIKLSIIRDKKKLEIEATLKNTSDDMYLVKTTRYDVAPSYFVYGGYVFSPLTSNLIRSTKRNGLILSYLSTQWKTKEKQESVVLLKVLPSDSTRGNNNFGMWPIEKMNGEKIIDFKDFYQKIESYKDKYIVLEDANGIKLVIDKKEAQATQSDLLRKYNIEYDRSVDLR